MSAELAPMPNLSGPRFRSESDIPAAPRRYAQFDHTFPGFDPSEARRGRRVAKCLRAAGYARGWSYWQAKSLLLFERILAAHGRLTDGDELCFGARELVDVTAAHAAILKAAKMDTSDGPTGTRSARREAKREKRAGIA